MSEAGSGIEGLRPDSAFARLIADSLKSESFKLVDVGCSGGLASGWRTFGSRLAAIGFDGEADEVARLNAAETNPQVRFVAGWIGLPEAHPLRQRIGDKAYWHNWSSHRYAYERQQDLRAARRQGRPEQSLAGYFKTAVLGQDWATRHHLGYDTDYAATFQAYPPTAEQAADALAAPGQGALIDLCPYLKGAGFDDADFLKLDIDGPDYEVLRSAADLLARPTLLGAALEVNFIGSHDANDNSFHNMDRLMREKGFDLLGLSVRTYASAALPSPYLDAHPSMNEGGRPIQGDAIYIRDLGSRVRAPEAARLSDEKLAKAAALLALFSLPDYAAEMLIVHRDRLARVFDVDAGLDLLALDVQVNAAEKLSYVDYIAAFEREDPRFFDVYTKRNGWMNGLIATANAAPGLAAEREALQAEIAALTHHVADLQASLDRAEARAVQAENIERSLQAITASTSWRLTAPLRGLLGVLRGRR